jgi:TP901 family phage tail tape measure protein
VATRILEVHITGDSVVFDRAMAAATKSAATAATGIESAGLKMQAAGKRIESTGKSLTRNVSLPLLAVGVASVKMAADFNRSMGEIATQAGASEKEVKKFTKLIRDAASHGRFAQSNEEVSKSLFDIESGGFRAAKAWKILKSASDLAAVGNADMESTTSALVGAMKTGIKGAHDSTAAIGALNAIIGAGKLHMEDLNAAIGTGFLGSAKAFGISISGAGSALAELTAQGVPAESAATRLRMAFSLLGAPSKKAKEVLEEIGVGSEDLAKKMQSSGGIVTALKLLETKMQGMSKIEKTQLLSAAFGGARSGGTILQLIGKLGDLADKQDQVIHGASTINDAIKRTNAEPAVRMEKSWRQIENSLEEIGENLLPIASKAFKEVAGTVSDLAGDFHNLPKGTQETIVKAGILLVALGPVLTLTGKLLSGWGKFIVLIGKAGRALGILSIAETAAGTAAGGAAAGGAAAGAEGAAVRGGAGALFGMGAGAATGGAAQVAGTALATSIVLTLPLTIGAVGIGKIATHTGHEMGNKIASGLGEEFESRFGPRLKEALQKNDLGELTALRKKLRLALNIAIAAGADDASLKPIREKLQQIGKEQGEITMPINNALTKIQLGGLGGLSGLNANLHGAMSLISGDWKKGTADWRKFTVRAMGDYVHSIKEGMINGTIKAKEGHDAIQAILGEMKIVKGSDPLGLATGFQHSFSKAHGITQSGVNRLLGDLEKMPKGARESAQDAVLKMANAWAHGHPKIEAQVDVLRSNLTHKFGKTNSQIGHGVSNLVGTVGGAFSSLAESVTGSISIMGVNISGILSQLGITKAIHFTLKVAKSAVKGISNLVPGLATGGYIVPGQGTGDVVHDALPPGSFVLNKKATKAFGFQEGGLMPVWLEPEERVFPPNEVKAYGLKNLEAMNDRVPRFATGGLVHPHLAGGPAPMRDMGQAMIDKVYVAALAVLRKKEAQLRSAGPGGKTAYGPKGIGTYMGVPMANWVIQALQYGAGHGSGNPQPTSGYRSHAQNVSEGRDYTSEHEFSQYPRGAVDFGGKYGDPAAKARKMAVVRSTAGFKFPLLAPIGFVDDGHASGTGHQLGGLVKQLFSEGGVVKTVGAILMRNALDAVSSAGILGNAYGESGWNPASVGSGGLSRLACGPRRLRREPEQALDELRSPDAVLAPPPRRRSQVEDERRGVDR